jgi:anthranilate phosphoribosyltransferase
MDTEHPFAVYIRTLGRGKRGARDLSSDEAQQAFRMILADQVLPEQLGAFLMLLRMKEETGTELAGFVRAAREFIPAPPCMVDLDWSSYAGKRRQLPWFLLSALLLAQQGLRIFMHGLAGRRDNRLYTPTALAALGITPSPSLEAAAQAIDTRHFAFVSLEDMAPRLAHLIALRDVLGLRSPVNSLARMLNPFAAPYVLQGIFHPGYRAIHRDAAIALGQAHMTVIKGEGGEIERNPDAPTEAYTVRHGESSEQQWPALFAMRHTKDETLDPGRLAAVWRGEAHDEYGEGAVIGTTAVALHSLGRATDVNSADKLARELWENRSREL